MHRTDIVVIGAGQAGLATSRCLTEAGRDHVVLERGRLAERWRSERWDSLRLLTPNWMTRLPGWSYRGPDPEGFMSVPELVSYFEGYAASFAAPVQEETSVVAVRPVAQGYRVLTDQGSLEAGNIVVATGHGGYPLVPAMAGDLSSGIDQVTSNRYRNADQLRDGGVLVVGASATGVQLAEELARAGREVVLSVGNHTRMPRSYRGMDIYWWMDQAGVSAMTLEESPDPAAARRSPSLQLIGRKNPGLHLGTLLSNGVRLAGRLDGLDGNTAAFADDLASSMAQAEVRMHRTLDTIDAHAARVGLESEVDDPDRPEPVAAPTTLERIDLATAGITNVLWATGFGRSYPWLEVPVLDRQGEIRHRRGVTSARGVYVVGLRFQHRRDSNIIDGVGRDARFVVDHLTNDHHSREELAA
jgi:putative flavoprotein involved in K+ transport